jgi:hypothetical protein
MSTRERSVAFAAVVAVLLGAGWFVFTRIERPVGGPADFTATGPMSIWPESPFDPEDALRREQDLVDRGHDAWRLDEREVVARFAKSVFGWGGIEIQNQVPNNAPATLSIRDDCGDSCAVDNGWIDVTIDQLVRDRPGGVWSVVAVHSDRLRLPVEPGDTVVAGDSLTFGLELASDQHAAVGMRFVQRIGGAPAIDCRDAAAEAGVTAADPSVTVPDPLFKDESCSDRGTVGYVFAYATPRLTVQVGDPLLEAGSITDLSIVPVRFSQEPVAPSPSP